MDWVYEMKRITILGFVIGLVIISCSAIEKKEKAIIYKIHNCELGCKLGKCCMKCDDIDLCCCKHWDKCPCPPDARNNRREKK